MITVYIHIIGVFAFTLGALILGYRIRKRREKDFGRKQSRIMHFLFHSGLTIPAAISPFYPGLKQFDKLLGLPSIANPFTLVAGILILATGLYFITGAIMGLGKEGKGAPAFKLTENIARRGVYDTVRNPMSIGHYMLYIGVSLIAGSSYLLLGSLLFVIPAHIFHLKYFEEVELEIRYGESYLLYKKQLPFLIPKISKIVR